MASTNPEQKKRKLSLAEQTATQTAIDKLAALNLTFSSVPATLASELISPLKPGIGLLGTPAEEAAFYASYVQSMQNESTDADNRVSLPHVHSKDTPMTDHIMKKDQANTQAIGAADLDET